MRQQQPKRSAIFLDRDGTLNEDKNYVHRWEDWRWLPGVIQGLRKLQQAGYMLVIASNQSGIARGFYPEKDWHELCRKINYDLAHYGIRIDGFYFCPHHPDFTGPCQCRKPLPGLLLQAIADLNLDPASSWLIGDKRSDAEAALAAGCRPVLLQNGLGKAIPANIPGAPDFMAAVDLILSQSGRAVP